MTDIESVSNTFPETVPSFTPPVALTSSTVGPDRGAWSGHIVHELGSSCRRHPPLLPFQNSLLEQRVLTHALVTDSPAVCAEVALIEVQDALTQVQSHLEVKDNSVKGCVEQVWNKHKCGRDARCSIGG